MTHALLFALFAAMCTATGGAVALRTQDRLHLVLGLSGGLLLGLVSFDLLPTVFGDQEHVGGVPVVALLLVAGFLTLHLIERFFATHGEHEEEGDHSHGESHGHLSGTMAAVAMGGHVFLDGVGIGAAFRVSTTLGVAVSVALMVHAFNDGLNTVGMLVHRGRWSSRARLLVMADVVLRVGGSAVGSYALLNTHIVDGYLAFFTGIVIYVATSHILPEAHATHPSRWTLLLTVVGALIMWGVVASGA
jgi:ZIP family zinc transporter